jgi:uncharacterized repeat protein (TIGR02543 family)
MHWNEVVGGTDNRKRRVAGLAVIAAVLALACMPIAARAVESARRETIAVVDTCDQGGIDDNGHGSDMVQTILAEDPNANVITVKALGNDGSGSGLDAARGIREAVGRGAKVIDLSAAGRLSGDELTALNDAITWAKGRGATIYMVAGNFGLNDDGLGISADAVRVGALGDDGGIRSTSDAGASVDGYVKADSTSRATAIAAARAAEGKDPFDKGTAIRVARAARVGIPDDGRLHAQAGYVKDWTVADKSGSHHWVFFCTFSDNSSPTMHVRTWVGSTNANLDVKPSTGSWTRNGRTFNRAYIVDNATVNNNALIRIQINGYFFKIGRTYETGEYELGYPSSAVDMHPKVTIDGNGGTTKTTSLTMSVGNNDYCNWSFGASRTGYDYLGLYSSATGGTKIWEPNGTAAAAAGSYWVWNNQYKLFWWKWDVPVTVYAQWKAHAYTIDCEGNPETGESTLLSPASKTLSATYDSDVTLPSASDFTYKGHTLTGWNTAADGSGTSYAPGATVKNLTSEQGATVKLYAQWSVTPFTVAIYPNGGRTPNGNTIQQTISATNGFCYVGICTRSNYDFAGYKVEGATGSASSSTLKDYGTFTYGNFYNKTRDYLSNYHLTAQWNPWTETIRYDGNGATGGSTADSTFTYSDNGTYNLRPCGFTKTGYSFVGWSTTTDSSGLITDYSKWLASKNGETVTVHAIWKQTTFTITYNANGGSGAPTAQSFTYDNGESVSATKPTRTGYDFAGWNTKADGSGTAIAAGGKIPTGTQNVTLYAQWKAHTYYVKFDGSGSTGGSMSTVTATYGKVAQLPANAYTKAGYTFAGWATSKGGAIAYGDKASFTNLTATQGATVTLYSIWSTNGSTKYTVNHWQEQLDGSYKVTDTQTLYSAWGSCVTPAPLSYTGFSSPSAKTVTVAKDGSTTVDYRYTRNSYGLTVSGILDGRAVASLPASCTVDVYSNGSKVASGVTSWKGTVKYGAKFEVRVTATASGYARHAEHDGGTASGTMGTSGASYAPALATTYKISYTLNGGSVSGQPTTYDYYTSRTIPAATRDGYAFAGWTGSNGTTPQKAVTIPAGQTGDKSYTANWTANTYKVTYDANGGSGTMANSTATYNANFNTTKNAFTRTGYTFIGWNEKADGTGTWWYLSSNGVYENGNGANPWKWTYTHDLTLYAQWKANTYTITYDANGGSGAPAAQSFTYGSGAKLSQTKPTLAGKSFTGWNTAKDGSGTAIAAGAAIPATWQDTTLYAQWATAPTVDAVAMVQDGTDGWWAYAKVTDHGTGLRKVAFPTWTEANGQDDIQSGWSDASSTSAAGTAGSWTVGGTTYNWRYHVLVTDHKGEYGRYNTHVYAYDSLGGYGVRTNPSYIMTFTVSYDLGGGSASGNPSSYTSEDSFTLKNPTRTGYTFAGWTGTGLSSASTSVSVAKGSHGNRSYKANWTIKTAYLDLNGSFEGTANSALVHATADVSVDGGSTWSTGVSDFYKSLDYGTKVVVRNVKAATGYTLTGVTVSGGASGLAHDVTAGTWSFTTTDATTYVVGATRANTYTVKFDKNATGATGTIANVSAKYGTTYTAPSSGFTYAGYTLSSWNTKADGSGTKVAVGGTYSNLTATDGGTVTLYAQWTLNTSANYTVNHWQEQLDGTYKVSDTETKSAAWGSSVTPATKAYAGFTAPSKQTVTVAKDGSTTVDYKYSRNSYKLTVSGVVDGKAVSALPTGCAVDVYSNGAKVASGVTSWRGTVKYGAKFEVRVTATASGYARHADHDGGTASGTMGTSGATYAPCFATTYSISYTLNGGSVSGQPTTYDYYTSRTLPAPTRDGYTFAGWTGSNGTTAQKAVTIPTGQTGNKSYTANWTANTYKVTYDANGGTGAPAAQSFAYNSGAKLSATTPTRTGYTFTGWNTAKGGTGTAYAVGASIPSGTKDLTLYAQWKANSYSVKFDKNATGATGTIANVSAKYGTSYTAPSGGFTYAGRKLVSWNTKADGTGTKVELGGSYKNLTATDGGTVTLYAQWATISYTIAYKDTLDSSWSNSTKVAGGETVTIGGQSISHTGKTLTGWNTKADGSGTGYKEGQKVTNLTNTDGGTVTLYAQWANWKYTIHFDGNGAAGGSMADQSMTYGTAAKLSANAFKPVTGSRFVGWKDAATGKTYTDGQSVNNLATKDGQVITLTAQWTPITYKVHFDGNGSTSGSMSDQSMTYATAANLTGNAFSKMNYVFTGWNTATDGSGTAYADKASVKNLTATQGATVTLYAQWRRGTYTINYKYANGSAISSQRVNLGDAVSLAASPALTGYTFTNWNTNADGTGTSYKAGQQVINLCPKDGDSITLYLQSTPWTAKVHFDGNGSDGGSMSDQTLTWAQATNLSKNGLTRTGHTFTGWNTKKDGSGTGYADAASYTWKDVAVGNGGTITLYAQWKVNTYTDHINHWVTSLKGKEGNNNAKDAYKLTSTSWTQQYGSSLALDASRGTKVPNGTKLVHAGSSDFAGKWVTYTIPATVTQPAKDTWTDYYYGPTNYTITYDLGGGTNDASNPATYNVLYGVTLKNPTRKGYEFAGWYDKVTGKRVTGINEGANATFTSADDLYAKLATRTTGNVELEARWKTKYVDVTFHRNTSSTDTATTTVRYSYDDWAAGKALAFSSQGWTRTGYTQLGWSNSDSDTAADYSVTNGVNGDWILEKSPKTDLYAVWKAWWYKVHFDGNGAASGSMADQSLTWDKDANLSPIGFAAPTGMRFVGWNTAKDGSGTSYADKAAVRNLAKRDGDTITLYAQWRYVTYKVHFDGNGSTSGSMSDQSMTYATAANLAANAFSRSHHVFTGWNTKKDGSGTAYADKASVKNLSASEGSTVTLYAQWRKSVYTIRYVDQAGATVSTQKANAGESVTIADYTKAITGASFTGWNTKQDGSGTAYKANASVPALSDADGATVTLWLQTRAWTAKVHFDGNGATSGSMSDQTLTWARAATLARNGYSRAGYTFTGWNTKKDGSGTGYTNGAGYTWNSTDVAKDGGTITLYAQWEANTYTVRYHANASDAKGTMADQTMTYDQAANLTKNAFTRDGYWFSKWATAANGGTELLSAAQQTGGFSDDPATTANATGAPSYPPMGYQSYSLLKYSKTLYVSPTAPSITPGSEGAIITLWTSPKSSNSKLVLGYAVEYSDGTKSFVAGTVDIGGSEVGTWGHHFRVLKASDIPAELNGKKVDQYVPFVAAKDDDLYFTGLSVRQVACYSDGRSVSNLTSTANGTVDLYAQWVPKVVSVKFDGNGSDGGSTAGFCMTEDTSKALTRNGFTRVGYSFTGWNTKADGSGTAYADGASFSYRSSGSGKQDGVTLYAQWQVNTYTDTIAHWMCGFQRGEGNNGTAKNAYLLGTTSWRQDFGTQVTYDAARQTKVPNGTYLNTLLNSPSFDVNWKVYDIPHTFTQPARDAYVEYYYLPITYTITYDLAGGTNDASNPATYNVLYGITLKDPTRKGYEFAGWYDKATGKRVTGINEGANATFTSADDLYAKLATRTTGNVELEARWKTKYVDVTFHRNTSTTDATTSTVRYSYDDLAAGKALAFSSQGWTRTGYTQLGWSADASDTAADYSVTNGVSGDWILEKSPKTDLYAVWKINQYSVDVNVLIDGKFRNNSGAWEGKSLGSWGDKKIVTFDTYVNGSKVGTGDNDFYKMLDYNSKVELRNIKPAEGFELDPATVTSETVPAYNTELIIRLNQTAYKISYDLAGGTFGTQAAPTSYHIGDAPVTIPTPTREHHVFLGWTGSNGTTPQASVTIPTGSTGDRSFTANWRNDRYTVKFDKNSADASGSIADLACEWGKDYRMPEGSAYSRTGWHVTSWNTKADGTGTVVALGATARNLASGDGATVTLYAQWAPNAYAIAYDGNGATAGSMAPTAATYGTDVKLSANAFSRSGYEFAGWATSATGGTEQLSAAEQGGTLTGEIAASVTAKATGAPDWAPTAWGGYAKLATATDPQAVSPNARWAAGSSGRLTLWAAPEGTGAIEAALELHLADGSVAYADAATTQLAAGSWGRVTLDATVPTTWEGKAVSYAQPTIRATGGAAYVTGLSSKVGVRYADGATVRDLTSERDATVTLHAQWEPRVATVTFDGNGATSGTMAPRSLLSTEAGARAPECAFERRGYEFTGWNTKRDGSGVAVAAGAGVTYASLGGADRVTLYAQWQTKAYTIVFDADNGDVSEPTRSVRYLSQVGTLPTATRPGSTFIGWFDASGKQWGATTTMPIPDNGESITLYAKWGFDASNLPDHLINGDFDFYPADNSARVNGKGVYIDPINHRWMDISTWQNAIAAYERSTGKVPTGQTLSNILDKANLWHGWGGYFTMWDGSTGFGWLSYQKGDLYDRAQVPSGIQVTYLYQKPYGNISYAEIDAHTVGTLYQDVATTPGAIMHMELDHASVTGMFEAMTVLIGNPSNGSIQNKNVDLAQFSPATLTSAPFNFTRPNFRRVDSAATNYGTTPAGEQTILFNLKVPPVDPKTGRQESGYLGYVGNVLTANKNTGWTRWEGFYRVPAGQTATRFTFKTLAFGTNQQQGNLIKHVRFEQWYPLWYDANDFDAASGGIVSGDLPTPTVSEQDAKSYLYYGAGTQVDANTACYLNTVTNKSWDPTKLTKRDASGEELTFLGWSDVPITHAVSTKAEYEDAQRHIKAASKYKVAKTTVDNRVYAVWARQPRVTFDLNYVGAPDGMLSPDAKGRAATGAVATQTIAGVFTQAGVKDKVSTDPADIDGSWSTTQGVGGTWDGKVTGVRSGWKFQGWYTSPGCEDGTRYDFSTPVTQDVTLYAKWARGMSLTYDYATDSAIRDGDTVALSGGGTKEVANGLPRTVTGPEYWDGNTVSAITVPAFRDAVITRTLPGGTKRQYQVSLVPTGWGYDRARAILGGDATTRADVGGGTDCSKSESIRLDWARTGGTGTVTVYVRYDPTVVDGVTTFAK